MKRTKIQSISRTATGQSDFAQLLNAMGFPRAKFNHVMVKKVERPGQLQTHMVPWRDLITYQMAISNGADARQRRRARG
jgi:hypothetical protein